MVFVVCILVCLLGLFVIIAPTLFWILFAASVVYFKENRKLNYSFLETLSDTKDEILGFDKGLCIFIIAFVTYAGLAISFVIGLLTLSILGF